MPKDKSPAARASDLCVPRGLEAYVPALAGLRQAAWCHLPKQLKIILELADYFGLSRTLELTLGELDDLYDRLPGPLLRQAFAVLPEGAMDGLVFPYDDGRQWYPHMVITAIAEAFSKVNENLE